MQLQAVEPAPAALQPALTPRARAGCRAPEIRESHAFQLSLGFPGIMIPALLPLGKTSEFLGLFTLIIITDRKPCTLRLSTLVGLGLFLKPGER